MPNAKAPRRNTRSIGSAAAQAGCCGLPEPGYGPRLGDGGLFRFCVEQFNPAFDSFVESRPEMRGRVAVSEHLGR